MTASAQELVAEIRTFHMRLQEELKPGQMVEITVSGTFGIHRFTRMVDEGHGLVRFDTINDVNQRAYILTPFEYCSFRFSIITPTEEERAVRPPMGFGPLPESKLL